MYSFHSSHKIWIIYTCHSRGRSQEKPILEFEIPVQDFSAKSKPLTFTQLLGFYHRLNKGFNPIPFD